MPYTQNIIILLFASLFVVGLWYTDKEIKNVHANIKIIQNMLKIVLSNQNSLLKDHDNSLNGFNQINDYIPYSSETPIEDTTELHTIVEENENELSPANYITESVETHEKTDEVVNIKSINDPEKLSEEEEIEQCDKTEDIDNNIENTSKEEPMPIESELQNEVSQSPVQKKKRQYRKKASITV